MANDNDDYDDIIQSVYARTYHNFLLAKTLHLTNRPWPWFIVVCALIDNDIHNRSGQNSEETR